MNLFALPTAGQRLSRALQVAPDSTAGPSGSADSVLSPLAEDARLTTLFREMRADFFDSGLWLDILARGLSILIILLLTWFILRLIDRMTAGWTRRFESLPAIHPRRQRAFTIGNLINSTARYVLWPIAAIMILSELNVDVGALIATAGIAGLAIGFGAQTLVKDVIGGIFLLFDDTIHVGDYVKIGEEAGTVEYIGVRMIKVRKFDGELLMVPAGELRIFGNRSIDFARVIVEVGVAYEQKLDDILPVVERVAEAWAAERRAILRDDRPTVQAVTSFGDSSVNLRVVARVTPGEQWQAERDLRLALKRAFDEAGIEIPFPRRTVYVREEKDARATPSPPKPPPN
ncbi:mechanosensitive ion channel family protein [Rhodocaloribacter sp.]